MRPHPFPVALTQKPPPAAEALSPDYQKLVEQHRAAQIEYYAPLEKIQDQKKLAEALQKLDPKKSPDAVFRARFERFATRGVNRATRTAATLQTVQMLRPNEQAFGRTLMERAVSENLNDPGIERISAFLTMMDGQLLAPGVAKSLLEKIHRDATSPNSKACALFQLAQLAKGEKGGAGTFRALLARVQREYPTTRFAAMAERNLFEMDHLQIGMVAPDFEATDENGAKFKLTDYRGKVVVVDFWGFW